MTTAERQLKLVVVASLTITLAVTACERRPVAVAATDASPDGGATPVGDSRRPADLGARETAAEPFLVETTLPASSEWGVACGTSIQATLNRDVDPASITPATFTVTAKGSAVAGSFTVHGPRAIFQPRDPLPAMEPVSVTLTSGVLDTRGVPLERPYSWTFGCDRQWSSPLTIIDNASPLSVTLPQVSLSDGGSAIVVWHVDPKGTSVGSVAFSRCELSTGSCTAPETLGADAYGFDLAGNGDGQVIVVGRGTSALWSRELDPATKSWRPASTVASIAMKAKQTLDVSMDGLGNATVIWSVQGEVKVRRYAWQAAAWEPEAVLDSSPMKAIQVRVAETSSGGAVALWGLSKGIQGSLMASRREGQGWAAPTRVSAERPETKFSVGVDQAGSAIVVWAEQATASPGIWSSRLAAGTGAWSAPFRMDPTCCAELPFVAMSSGGKAVVAWNGSNMALETRRYDPGTDAWTPPLSFPSAFLEGDPALTMDPDGNAIVAWGQIGSLSVSAVHLMRFYDKPAQWGPTVEMSGVKGAVHWFAVDSNATGQAIVASQAAAIGCSELFVSFLR